MFGLKLDKNTEEEIIKRGATRFTKAIPKTKPQPKKIKFNNAFWMLIVFLLFSTLFGYGVYQLSFFLNKPIKNIQVQGKTQHLDKRGLAVQLTEYKGQPLLSVDLKKIQQQLTKHPWVHQAKIQRVWPQKLQVSLIEEVPIARWGQSAFLNQKGKIFLSKQQSRYNHLPVLQGNSNETGAIIAQFYELNQMLRQIDLNIIALEQSRRGAWILVLNNNIKVKVGRSKVKQRLDRFVKIYRWSLSARAGKIAQVDVRYANGIAVNWK